MISTQADHVVADGSTSVGSAAHPGFVDEPEPGWGLGDQILVDLPDGQVVRCRIVNITPEGTLQVVPEHGVIIG